jgi:hypothetical protein
MAIDYAEQGRACTPNSSSAKKVDHAIELATKYGRKKTAGSENLANSKSINNLITIKGSNNANE